MYRNQIQAPWGVSAFGAASVRAMPDLARVRMAVERTEETPEEAFRVGREAVAGVRRVLREHGVPDKGVSGSQLKLSSSYRYVDDNRRFVGYRCEAAFTVETVDLDGLQSLLIDVVAAGANKVDGVEFDVAAKPKLRAEARRKAVQAARAKAELYAEAAGVTLGEVLHIEDVDPEEVGNERYRGHSSGGGSAEDDLAPGQVVVSAAVSLGFAIARP